MLFEQWKSSKFSKLNEDDSLNGPPTADLANITIEEFFNMQPKAKSRFIMSLILSNINSNINQRIRKSDIGSIEFVEGVNKLDFITWGRDLETENGGQAFVALAIPTTLQGWNAISKKGNVKLGDNIGKLPILLNGNGANEVGQTIYVNTKENITVSLAYIIDKFTKINKANNLLSVFMYVPQAQDINNINITSVMQSAAANAEKSDPEWAAGLKDYKDDAKSYAGNKDPNNPEASTRSTTPKSPLKLNPNRP